MKKLILAVPNGSLFAPTIEMFKKAGLYINFSGRILRFKFMAITFFLALF